MPSTFTAVAQRRRSEYRIHSTVQVFHTTADGLRIPIAQIQDSADPADHRHTEIIFSEGRLVLEAAYDGPIRKHFVWPFSDENHCEMDLALHDFPYANRSYLCSADGCFPIKKEKNHKTFTMTIYGSSPLSPEDGVLFSALATITQTRKFENGFEYNIQAEENLPASLLMAIFSLPFTLLNLN